ncbi:MAG: hypothetical protein GY730_00745 [bacterium]|nr:hypothetical protein [bacterium]
MADIELSALSKQCLYRRIANIEFLANEVYAWTKARCAKKTLISWQFTKHDAREKLLRFYKKIKK